MSACRSCKRWQLSTKMRKYRNCADCNWVIGSLAPALFEARNVRGYRFSLPFDPHTVADFDCDDNFKKQFIAALYGYPKGVQVEKHGDIYYFQTEGEYWCEYYEPV